MSRLGTTELEWRMLCVMLYESLSEQERKKLELERKKTLKNCGRHHLYNLED
ncbi:hypothetical protein HYT51_02390 [Candidatus Woesearchaeota archaeon]|nr:hypothetical protein [Candidatus Woesearchaeota archaeon]